MRIGVDIRTERVRGRPPAPGAAIIQDDFGRDSAASPASPVIYALNADSQLVSQSLGSARVLNVDFESFHAQRLFAVFRLVNIPKHKIAST